MQETGAKQALGKKGEEQAQQYLKRRGYVILITNYRAVSGEIDIIAWDHQTLVFIEVKTRRNLNFGSPLEAVNLRKQLKIRKTALHYLSTQAVACRAYRFDVISLLSAPSGTWQIDHIVNAF